MNENEFEEEEMWQPTTPDCVPGEVVYEISSRKAMRICQHGEEGRVICEWANPIAAGERYWCVKSKTFRQKMILPPRESVPIAWIRQGCSKTQPPEKKVKRSEAQQGELTL